MDSTKNILAKFEKWFRKISPPLPISGMHITDFAVRYSGFKGGGMVRESIRLEPGIIEHGVLKNRDTFLAVLKELRRRVLPNEKKSISVVLSLPIRDVYIQTFSVPKVAEEGFKEAADLNARMISPINVDDAYYNWQRISEDISVSVDVKMLGAFVQKAIADEFISAIETAGFGIAAVEFESLSLARSISRAKLVGENEPYIIVQIAAEGISIVVVRSNVPHFHYFHSWIEVQGDEKTISIDSFKNAIGDELERVINFYFTHWSGEPLGDVIVVASTFGEEISKVIAEKSASLRIQIVDPANVNAVVGAALRGTVQRSEDREISLASLTALGVFEHQQVKNFVRIWRNIFITSLGFLLALFVSTNIFLRSEIADLNKEKESIVSAPSAEELASLSEEVAAFNGLVQDVAVIQAGGVEPSSFLVKISEIAGEDIGIVRISFNPSGLTVLVNGLAPNETAAVNFKNRIGAQAQFYDADLPLQSISTTVEGVSFTLNFKVRSFDFGE